MTQTHRVAVIVQSQVVMDIEAENNLKSIKAEALRSFQAGEGDPEITYVLPLSVNYHPFLAEGEKAPAGAKKVGATEMRVHPSEIDGKAAFGF